MAQPPTLILDKLYRILLYKALFPQGEASIVQNWWQRRRACDHAQVLCEASEAMIVGKLQVKKRKSRQWR